MKDLLVYVPPVRHHPRLIEYAASLAASMDAHLDGATFTILPQVAGHFASLPDNFYRTARENSELEAANAGKRFLEYARNAGVGHAVRNFESFANDAEDLFACTAQAYDLAIVPQTDREDTTLFNPQFDSIMLMTGRPTLFVPTIHRGRASLERVLVCWNGDRFAARAVGDGMPLLKRAKTVDVLQIGPLDTGIPRCEAAELVRHLQRHGVSAKQHTFARDNPDVGAAILSFAADCGSNLIMMGGYGHSRAREMLFGGVTRELLESMTVPVLMSH